MSHSDTRWRFRLAVLAALLVGALALAGCGGGSETGGTATGSTATGSESGSGGEASATPKPGGTLTLALNEEVTTLAPQRSILPAETIETSQINEPLWQENLEGELVPWLIEKVETSKDDRVYTLHLKTNVKFSNGQPMTSADVLYTLEQARKSEYWESLLVGITKVEATSPSTIVITNAEPAAELPAILSQWSFGIEPKNLAGESEKEFEQKPIGTGPFKVASFERGVALTLEKNPYYWQPNLPYLDKVVIKIAPDANARVAQLNSGELDVIDQPPWSQVEAIENSPETEFGDYPLGFNKLLFLNVRKPIFKNMKVREAVNLALDREGMINVAMSGHGEPSAAFVPPPIAFHDPSISAPEQNAEKAQELLAEAVKEGVNPSFTLATPLEDSFFVSATQVIQQNLEEVGFNVKIQKLDGSSLFEALETGKYEAAPGYIYTPVATPTEIFGFYNSFEAQFTGGPIDETTKLFNEALSEPNKAKREQLYFKLQEIVEKEQAVIPIAYEPFSWALRKNVVGFYVGNVGIPWLYSAGVTE
jgi:peptide/nickel transport system substrate-binding protein